MLPVAKKQTVRADQPLTRSSAAGSRPPRPRRRTASRASRVGTRSLPQRIAIVPARPALGKATNCRELAAAADTALTRRERGANLPGACRVGHASPGPIERPFGQLSGAG
jgi:hypothetical protein